MRHARPGGGRSESQGLVACPRPAGAIQRPAPFWLTSSVSMCPVGKTGQGGMAMGLSRRRFLAGSAATGTSLFLYQFVGGAKVVLAEIPGGSLDPVEVS
jgi:hypothetical protein